MMFNALVIVNPVSRGGRFVYKKLKKLLGDFFTYHVNFTEFRGHAITISSKLKDNVDFILVCGGDGTTNEVVNGLIKSKNHCIPIALTYGGSGSDLPKTLKISKEIAHRIEQIYKNLKERNFTSFKASYVKPSNGNIRYFLGVGDAGFGGIVAQEFDKFRKFARLGYAFAVYKALVKSKLTRVKFIHEKGKDYSNLLLLAFARTKYFGGGMMISPSSNPFSNHAYIIVAENLTRKEVIYHFPKIYKGKHILLKGKVREIPSSYLEIQTPNLPIEVEGEYAGITPAFFTVSDFHINFI